MMEHVIVVSAALGAVVGLILALTGAGGAILAVPLLLFVLDLTVADAGPVSSETQSRQSTTAARSTTRSDVVLTRG
jgi:uncharacterized protein